MSVTVTNPPKDRIELFQGICLIIDSTREVKFEGRFCFFNQVMARVQDDFVETQSRSVDQNPRALNGRYISLSLCVQSLIEIFPSSIA